MDGSITTQRAAASLWQRVVGAPLWAQLLACDAVLLAGRGVLFGRTNELHEFRERAIGPAILEGVDPSARQTLYLALLVGLPILALVALFVLDRLQATLMSGVRTSWRRHLELTLAVFSGASTLMVLLSVLTYRADLLHLAELPLCLIVVVLGSRALSMAFRPLLRARGAAVEVVFRLDVLFLFGMVPVFAAIAGWAFERGRLEYRPSSMWTSGLLSLVEWAVLLLWAALARASRRGMLRANRLLVVAGTPLFFIPLAPIFATEWSYRLAQSPRPVSTATLTAFLIGALAVLAVGLGLASAFLRARKRANFVWLSRHALAYVWLPLVVGTTATIAAYSPTTGVSADLLHLGNHVVPAQQWLEFGKLPFFEVWYARGLTDVLPGTLYGMVNGTQHPLDEVLWVAPILAGLASLAAYAALAVMFSPAVAALGIVLLPTADANSASILSGYYSFGIVPGLVLLWAVKRPSPRRWVALWATVGASFLWMPSLGSATVPASIILVVLIAATRKDVRTWAPVLAFITVFGVGILSYLCIVVLRGHSISETLRLIRAFSIVDRLIGSYPMLYSSYGAMVVIQYGLLPLAGLLAIGLFALRGSRGEWGSTAHHLAAYLALAGLALQLRALHRHCLFEGFQTGFLAFTTIVFPWLISKSPRAALATAGAVVVFVSALTPTYRATLPAETSFGFHEWTPGEQRVALSEEDSRRFHDLKDYLDSHLRADQTFAEFISGHLLYSLVHRSTPFFHHSAQLLQSDDVQKVYIAQWEKLLEQDKVPLVILASRNWWGSQIDGIPSTMSLFRIAEFVYEHYRPVALIQGYEIWGPRSPADLKTEAPPVTQVYSYKRLAEIWANHDSGDLARSQPVLADLVKQPTTLGSTQALSFTLDGSERSADGNYLHARVVSPSGGELEIHVAADAPGPIDTGSISFWLEASPQPHDYVVRVSTLWTWWASERRTLAVSSKGAGTVEVQALLIRKGD